MAEHTEKQRIAFAASVAARDAIERANASDLTDAERKLFAAVLGFTLGYGRLEDNEATIGQVGKVANIRSDKTVRGGLTKLASLGIIEYETRRGKYGGGITLRLITGGQGDQRALAWALAEAEHDPRRLRHEDWAPIRDVAAQLLEDGMTPADVHERAARLKERIANNDQVETGTPITTGLPAVESGSPSTTELDDTETGTTRTTELEPELNAQTGSQTGNQTGNAWTTDTENTENTENHRDVPERDFAIATSRPGPGPARDETQRKHGTCTDCNEDTDLERLGNNYFCARCIESRRRIAYTQPRR